MATPDQPATAEVVFTGTVTAEVSAVAHHPDGRPVTAADLEATDDDTTGTGGDST